MCLIYLLLFVCCVSATRLFSCGCSFNLIVSNDNVMHYLSSAVDTSCRKHAIVVDRCLLQSRDASFVTVKLTVLSRIAMYLVHKVHRFIIGYLNGQQNWCFAIANSVVYPHQRCC